jgi:hypothetical protein
MADETVIEILNSFNRKERFFLIGHALGNPEFRLSEAFRTSLSYELGIRVPKEAHCWMDYHLDWIYAALTLSAEGPKPNYPSPRFPSLELCAQGAFDAGSENINMKQSEDIDLLVGFQDGLTTHLVLIEAKGVTKFGNKQLHSKACKLGHIFGLGEKPTTGSVVPHFVLASPAEPRLTLRGGQGLDIGPLPRWMKPAGSLLWVQLPIPRSPRVAARFSTDTGRPDPEGDSWAVYRGRDLKHAMAEYTDASPETLAEEGVPESEATDPSYPSGSKTDAYN